MIIAKMPQSWRCCIPGTRSRHFGRRIPGNRVLVRHHHTGNRSSSRTITQVTASWSRTIIHGPSPGTITQITESWSGTIKQGNRVMVRNHKNQSPIHLHHHTGNRASVWHHRTGNRAMAMVRQHHRGNRVLVWHHHPGNKVLVRHRHTQGHGSGSITQVAGSW
jgi:hypothetical protein